jgi:hypothetical protein
MVKYKQRDFERELVRLLRKAIRAGKKTLRVSARQLSQAVTGEGGNRGSMACSALRRYANIEMMDGSGLRRGRCLNTTLSGNAPSVTYQFFLSEFTEAVFERLEEAWK